MFVMQFLGVLEQSDNDFLAYHTASGLPQPFAVVSIYEV